MKERVTGFDVARALAIFGMVIVNFKIAMNAQTGSPLLMNLASLFEGRASALFVILAGIGITFMTNKVRTSANRSQVSLVRMAIIKRGLLLVAVGLLFTPIWPADILHFYGVYFIFAAAVIKVSDKALLMIAAIVMLIFPFLMLTFNYDQNWDWTTLNYENFWSVDGMIRHIFFNGFHPVLPWAAFLIFGMWLGRQDLTSPLIRNRLLMWAIITFVVIEGCFYLIKAALGDGTALGMSAQEVNFLFSTSIIPPLPQYIMSAGASSVIVLIACISLSQRFPHHMINIGLYKTGQLALTLYGAHVIIGMGTLEELGLLDNQSIEESLLSALIFCTCAIIFSVLWLRFFKQGPLESVFRKLTS